MQSSENDQVTLITDGACRGNPGPGGWGAILRFKNSEKQLFGGEANTTNNRMELTAVIKGLRALKRPCKIQLITDSKYVMNGVTQWMTGWKRNGWRTADKKAVKNQDLWQELDSLSEQHDISWQWVKGHSGHPENELADLLANRGIDEL